MRATTPPVVGLLALGHLALAVCSGSGSDATVEANTPPAIEVPAAVTGGPAEYVAIAPVGHTTTLTFTATDPDGDPVAWIVGGTLFPAGGTIIPWPGSLGPIAGRSLTLEYGPTGPMFGTVTLLAEDGRGGRRSIAVEVWRPRQPVLSSVTLDSAFANAPREVTVTGDWSQLFGVPPNTPARPPESVRFEDLEAQDLQVLSLQELTCRTPPDAALGSNSVQASTAWGPTNVLAQGFTMLAYPVELEAADSAFDSVGGTDLVVGRFGEMSYAAFVENGQVFGRRSTDRGAS